MRTRQAQQLQADVYALLDEAVGVGAGGYATGVKPAPADVLESLNQQWPDIYGTLVQAGITWNMQTSSFSTVSNQTAYGMKDGAWWGNLRDVQIFNPGAGNPNGTFALTFTGVTFAPNGFIIPAGTVTVVGGAVTEINITQPGQGVLTMTGASFAGLVAPTLLLPKLQGAYWKTMGIDVQGSDQQWRNAYQATFQQRNDYPTTSLAWPYPVLYEIRGGTADVIGTDGTALNFTTPPQGPYPLRHHWFPAPQRLVNPTDVFDGVAGADRAMVFGAAQEMALMLEQFEQAAAWGQLRDQKVAKMLSLLRDRNCGEAPMARVVRGRPTVRGRYGVGGWNRGGW